MLASVPALLARTGGTVPPRGTGPLGAPAGGRWITRDDVLAWNANTDVRAPRPGADAYARRAYAPHPAPLRPYQRECVARCVAARGGIVHMECGAGKTHVGAALVAHYSGPAVVVVHSAVAEEQWRRHLDAMPGVRAVALQEDTALPAALPDAVVTTYHRVVRAARGAAEHRARLVRGEFTRGASAADRLLMLLMCEPFALLLLDEVHMVVADHFLAACALRAAVVFGLSGSLVREDRRIGKLAEVVGPVVFAYGAEDRAHAVVVVTVPCAAAQRAAAQRALNPRKVEALLSLLAVHRDERVIVFSDTVRAAKVLHATVLAGRSLLVHGATRREERLDALRTFAANPTLVLLCTRVCDASVDFPPGCVLVQYHLCSGSRQQEMQRFGRGTRGTSARLYHLVNAGTREEEFSARRVRYLCAQLWSSVAVTRVAPEIRMAEAPAPY